MCDGIAKLKSFGEPTFDRYGNPTATVTEKKVFVQPRGVYQSEFYNASQLGLKPSISFFISYKGDYNGEKVIEYEGRDYDVIRVDWSAQRDGITLVCEERVKNVQD